MAARVKTTLIKYVKMDLIKSISVTKKSKVIDIRLQTIDESTRMEYSLYDENLNHTDGFQYVLIMQDNSKIKLIDYLELN